MAHEFRIFRNAEDADVDCVRVTLFRGTQGICGWYLAPTLAAAIADGYMPPSAQLVASSAVLRAIDLASPLGLQVCIVDPDDLWPQAWGAS